MSVELYFVPILAKALAQPDVHQSLKNAFALIERLGHQERHAEGHGNFWRFMSESHSRRQLLNEQTIRAAILRIAEGTYPEIEGGAEPGPMEKDQSRLLENEYDALCQEFSRIAPKARAPVVRILCNGLEIGQVSMPTKPGRQTVDGINPGHYTLKLDCGLVIWEGQLSARDLIWTQAYGERCIELAAETTEIGRQPTREIQIPEVAVTLRTFAGLETGSLEIELSR
ncbi:MAG: hypothetical protein ACYSWQ_00270 [Planctomycetota bacterium]|jgi:hypothetical protein